MDILTWIILLLVFIVINCEYDILCNGTSYNLILPNIGSAKYDSVEWHYLKSPNSKTKSIAYWYNEKTVIKPLFNGRVSVSNGGKHNMTLSIKYLTVNDTGIYRQTMVLANSTEHTINRKLAVINKVWISSVCKSIYKSVNLTEMKDLLKKNTSKYEEGACNELETKVCRIYAQFYYNDTETCLIANYSEPTTGHFTGSSSVDGGSLCLVSILLFFNFIYDRLNHPL